MKYKEIRYKKLFIDDMTGDFVLPIMNLLIGLVLILFPLSISNFEYYNPWMYTPGAFLLGYGLKSLITIIKLKYSSKNVNYIPISEKLE